MPYMINATDRPDSRALRAGLRDAHLEHLVTVAHLIIAAGAKLSEDGATPIGSLYLLDVDTLEAAQDFLAADPFGAGGLFGEVEIRPWFKGYLDGREVATPR